ncbi:MAG: PilN domain-containing protein [Syntrophobacterales bacterium]|nr:PilN domain-containing protein [Syntrophobacterales bacterium]
MLRESEPGGPRSWWRTLSREIQTGAGSVGAYYDRRTLTLVHLEKGLTASRVQRVAQLPVPGEGLPPLAPAVQELVQAWGLENPPAGLAVSPRLGLMRPATLPAAAKANLARVVGYEIDRFLPLSPEQLVFDYLVVNETERELHLLLLGLPRALVEDWLTLCGGAGLSPVTVEPGPLAGANALAVMHGRPPAAFLLLAADGPDYDLLHFSRRRLRGWQAGKLTSVTALAELLPPEMPPEEAPQALYLLGSATLPAALRAGAGNLPFPVVTETQVALKGTLPPGPTTPEVLMAAGAALRGVGRVPFAVNLLPEGQRATPKLTGLLLTRFFSILLFGLVVVWSASIFIHSRIALSRVERQVAELAPAVREVEKQLQDTQNLLKQYDDLKRRVEQYPGPLQILRELTEIIPDHTHLYSFRLSKGQVELSGKSASASELINLLERSGRFTKTEFVSPIVTDETGSEIFKIKADIKGAARGS